MNTMKWQNDRVLREEFPRSVGTQYATGDQWRNNSRKNEGMEPKQNQYPVVDVKVIEERSDVEKRSMLSSSYCANSDWFATCSV